MLDHRHVLLTARGMENPPRTVKVANQWLLRLTEIVGMKVFFGPQGKRCKTVGNEGVTSLVCIETSHASMHCWDAVPLPFMNCDLYSCAHFESRHVIMHLMEFKPAEIEYMLIDRNGPYKVLEQAVLRFFPLPPLPPLVIPDRPTGAE